jgi:hypothetical protein
MRSVAHVQARSERQAASILRTSNTQIVTQPTTSDVQLDGQIGS